MPNHHYNTSIDSAFVALDEVFPGHPLTPAARQTYLSGEMFTRIGDSEEVYEPQRLWPRRIRPLEENAKFFWACMKHFYHLSLTDYLNWIQLLAGKFFRAIMDVAHAEKSYIKVLDRLKQALVRDYRYFRESEKARSLDVMNLNDSKSPEKEIFGQICTATRIDYASGRLRALQKTM